MIVTIHHMEQTFAKYLSTFVKYSFILISRLKLTEMLYELRIKTDMRPFKPMACYSNYTNQLYVNLTRFFYQFSSLKLMQLFLYKIYPLISPFQLNSLKSVFKISLLFKNLEIQNIQKLFWNVLRQKIFCTQKSNLDI